MLLTVQESRSNALPMVLFLERLWNHFALGLNLDCSPLQLLSWFAYSFQRKSFTFLTPHVTSYYFMRFICNTILLIMLTWLYFYLISLWICLNVIVICLCLFEDFIRRARVTLAFLITAFTSRLRTKLAYHLIPQNVGRFFPFIR